MERGLHRDPLAASSQVVRRFRHEAQAVAQLNHPRITHIYDFGFQELPDGALRPFVVMELVPGRTLQDTLAGGRALPWSQAASIVSQIADALTAAHRRGLVHRDVTPSNVMVGP